MSLMFELAKYNCVEMKTIVDICRSHSNGRMGDEIAYCFLLDGVSDEDCLTFSQLDSNAKMIASYLSAHQMKGERVLLLFSPGIDYICAFLGCLYAGAIAVPAFPPSGRRILPRLCAIVQDCQPTMGLTNADMRTKVDRFFSDTDSLSDLQIVSTDEIERRGEFPADCMEFQPSKEDIAFLQYTSGSTSEPKGVIISHRNLLENERMIAEAFSHERSTRVVGWLPPYHDMGLIGNILQPLYLGCPYYFMSPAKVIQDPFKWLSAISRYKGTTSGAPNFAYDLCVRKITDAQKKGLDLSSWRVAFNGSEPIRASSIDSFTAAFRGCGFDEKAWLPCYGLAEATLLVSGGKRKGRGIVRRICDAHALEKGRVFDASETCRRTVLVGNGEVSASQEVEIVDASDKARVETGTVGEIWIKGPNISSGYWKNDDLTKTTFLNRLDGAGPFLRTGDLGFIDNGELYVTGRSTDLIIIRGRNIYPQDIECLVQDSHEKVSRDSGAAFSFARKTGETALAIVQEVSFPFRQVNFGEMFGNARKAVREGLEIYIDEIVWVKPGSVPKTTSGKVQRAKCRELFLSGKLEFLAREADWHSPLMTEELDGLSKWVEEALILLVDGDRFSDGSRVDLFRLGLDSIQIIEFAHKVEASFGVRVPVERLFEMDTVSKLIEYLDELGCDPKRLKDKDPGNNDQEDLSIDGISEADVGRMDEKRVDELLKAISS